MSCKTSRFDSPCGLSSLPMSQHAAVDLRCQKCGILVARDLDVVNPAPISRHSPPHISPGLPSTMTLRTSSSYMDSIVFGMCRGCP